MTLRPSRRRRLAFWSMLFLLAGILPAAAGGHWPLYRPHHPHWYAVHGAIYDLGNDIALTQAIPWVDPDIKAWNIHGDRYAIVVLNELLPPPKWRWAVPCCYGRTEIRIPALKSTEKSAGSGRLQPLGDAGKAPPPARKPRG